MRDEQRARGADGFTQSVSPFYFWQFMISSIKKAILFDFFGVFCPDIGWAWLEEHIRDMEFEREYLKKLFQMLDSGEIRRDTFFAILGKRFSMPGKRILVEMNQRAVLDKSLIAIVQKIKRNYRTGLLSNANAGWLDVILHKHQLHRYFDKITVSSKIGYTKPHPSAFAHALSALGVNAQEVIFVDDRKSNIDAARQCGLTGIIYRDAKQLERELYTQGILSDE